MPDILGHLTKLTIFPAALLTQSHPGTEKANYSSKYSGASQCYTRVNIFLTVGYFDHLDANQPVVFS